MKQTIRQTSEPLKKQWTEPKLSRDEIADETDAGPKYYKVELGLYQPS
ncbi:hypothetical protein GCM10007939_20820 [Amylibacter marinus]|uniref:Coenzyme PQQ synthesis protein A n=1 Tax=Amylibacter marinus TaxID=1475483 RepID=A0ABQ5VWW2_9RHOB|nr:hypothetical protein [Amylibacter marinus]GLQ35799.1 hypothetical protein GCM10007939_20820 [Amylibacter marinus]